MIGDEGDRAHAALWEKYCRREAAKQKRILAERDAAIAERDELRAQLEALRDEMREWCYGLDAAACHRAVLYGPTIARLDAILRGES